MDFLLNNEPVPDRQWKGAFRMSFGSRLKPPFRWTVAGFRSQLNRTLPAHFTCSEEYAADKPVRLFLDYDSRQHEPVDHPAALQQLVDTVLHPVQAELRKHVTLDDTAVAVSKNHRLAPKQGSPPVSMGKHCIFGKHCIVCGKCFLCHFSRWDLSHNYPWEIYCCSKLCHMSWVWLLKRNPDYEPACTW